MSAAPDLRLVVGFSPGSASDDIAHLIAAPLGARLNRRVVIERIAGDNGAHAALTVARSAPDDNTLFVATLGTHALAPHVRKDLPYDAIRDFEPVSLLTQAPMLLACHPALPARDLLSFIAHARAHPGELAYGTSAIGGAPHLAAELFQAVTGVRLRHERYNNTNDLYLDLEVGHINLSFNNLMSMLPRCRTGMLRALAVTADQRCAVAPEVPTFAECGLTGCEMSNWVGLVAPRGSPATAVEALSSAVAAVTHSPEIAGKLIGAGITPCGTTPAAFGEFLVTELQHWEPVVTRFRQA